MSDNVVELKMNNFKFISIPIWINYIYHNDGRIEKKHFSLIAIKDIDAETHIIHPISQFILDNWRHKQFNTQKKHSMNTIKFLNYLIENKSKLKIKTLTNLTINDGTQYLNSLSNAGISRETIIDIERTLNKFFIWLSENNYNTKINSSDFKLVHSEFGSFTQSPFKPIYPNRTIKKIEHNLPISYIPLLLEVAINVAPAIVLGIYFQIFGGLRISEVVNLKRTQVSRQLKKGNFLLKLENQNFRTDLKEHPSVKKPRHQQVFDINNWGGILYRDHSNYFKAGKNTEALFLNRDGNALSERSYRQYFKKVKNTFIALLENHGDIEQRLLAKNLKYLKWSSHIGRGTFTNLIAEEADNPYEISHLRGDSNINSSLTYMVSTERMHKKIEEKFQNMHNVYIPKLINEMSEKNE
ncbi:site-specific integrase [Lysinibacillus sp. NPDC093197]|uniref:site-specific integrase n=1 Tax=Lysinibacillus sp. NPDC093197 TaxID=3364132 RepID=UPI003817F214